MHDGGEEYLSWVGLEFIEEDYNIVSRFIWQPEEWSYTIYNFKKLDPITIAMNCSSFFCNMGAMNVPTEFKLHSN